MKKLFLAAIAALPLFSVPAFDILRRPEMADENSFFVSAVSPYFSFEEGFSLEPPEFGADWLLPGFLPLSFGAYFKSPSPNLKSFGLRAAWHIDLGDRKTDLYFLYVYDFGWIRNGLLLEYGDEEQPVRNFDFRFGARRLFNFRLCLFIESAYKLQGLAFGLSAKLF